MKQEERKEVYKGLKKGDILQFRTCKDLMKASAEMEKQGFKSLQVNQINGTQGLFLIVTEKKQMISDYLLEKCYICKRLVKEETKLNRELVELRKNENADSLEISGKTHNFLEIEKELRNTQRMIARVLIEELGI